MLCVMVGAERISVFGFSALILEENLWDSAGWILNTVKCFKPI